MGELKTGVVIIAAGAKNRVIGKNWKLAWRIPSDMRYFFSQIKGKTIVIGRVSYEDLSEEKVKEYDVDVIVLTSTPGVERPGLRFAKTFKEALAMPRRCGELYVAGGARVYEEALAHAHRMLITRVHAEPEGDTFFPKFNEEAWCLIETPTVVMNQGDQYKTSLEKWVRA